MKDKYTLAANIIRIMTLGCKSKDVMSCEFGNEFAPRVEEYLREVFVLKDQEQKDSPFCEHCKEEDCGVSLDGTCELIRRYLKAVDMGVHVCCFGRDNVCLTCGSDFVPKDQPNDEIREKVLKLRCEVNCRIEHGAESGGHLDYVQKVLDEILQPNRA